MGKGRPPKPLAMKLAAGTYRESMRSGDNRLPHAKPRPAPDTLGKVGRERWANLSDLIIRAGVAKDSDWDALEQLCRAYDGEAECLATLNKDGWYHDTGHGKRSHPAVQILFRHRDQIRRYLIEFGMTPSARTQVKPEITADVASIQPRKRG